MANERPTMNRSKLLQIVGDVNLDPELRYVAAYLVLIMDKLGVDNTMEIKDKLPSSRVIKRGSSQSPARSSSRRPHLPKRKVETRAERVARVAKAQRRYNEWLDATRE